MLSRFLSNLTLGVLGGTLAAMSLLFGAGTVRWLALGGGCAALGLVMGAFLARGRGPVQRSLDAVAAIVSAWTIVASCSFAAGHVLRWLSFAEFAALCGCGLAGLIAHEVVMERSVRRRPEAFEGDGHLNVSPQLSDRPVGERVMLG